MANPEHLAIPKQGIFRFGTWHDVGLDTHQRRYRR
jgi:hypothetical protein